MTALNNFQINLKQAMQAQGLSQRHVATLANVSHPYVNRVLNGLTVPALPHAEKLAQAVGYSLADMISAPKIFLDSLLTVGKA